MEDITIGLLSTLTSLSTVQCQSLLAEDQDTQGHRGMPRWIDMVDNRHTDGRERLEAVREMHRISHSFVEIKWNKVVDKYQQEVGPKPSVRRLMLPEFAGKGSTLATLGEHTVAKPAWKSETGQRVLFWGLSTLDKLQLLESVNTVLHERRLLSEDKSTMALELGSPSFPAAALCFGTEHPCHDQNFKIENLKAGMEPVQISECSIMLKASFDKLAETEASALLRAINLVAVSVRPLMYQELLDAVTTRIKPVHSANLDAGGNFQPLHNDDVGQLCSRMLMVREDGSIDFSHAAMSRFLLSSGLLDSGACHTIMSTICLSVLQETATTQGARVSESRPGSSAKPNKQAFYDYARHYWQRHYRLSEGLENDLPERFRQLIESSIAAHIPNEQHLSIEVQQLTLSAALDISILCNFPVLQQLCRQAGAEVSSWRRASGDEQRCIHEALLSVREALESDLASKFSQVGKPKGLKL